METWQAILAFLSLVALVYASGIEEQCDTPQCDRPDQTFPNCRNCSSYLKCGYGNNKELVYCPKGQFYNIQTGSCGASSDDCPAVYVDPDVIHLQNRYQMVDVGGVLSSEEYYSDMKGLLHDYRDGGMHVRLGSSSIRVIPRDSCQEFTIVNSYLTLYWQIGRATVTYVDETGNFTTACLGSPFAAPYPSREYYGYSDNRRQDNYYNSGSSSSSSHGSRPAQHCVSQLTIQTNKPYGIQPHGRYFVYAEALYDSDEAPRFARAEYIRQSYPSLSAATIEELTNCRRGLENLRPDFPNPRPIPSRPIIFRPDRHDSRSPRYHRRYEAGYYGQDGPGYYRRYEARYYGAPDSDLPDFDGPDRYYERDEPDRYYDGSGGYYDGPGRYYERSGRYYEGRGRYYEGSRRYYDGPGRYYEGSGRYYDGSDRYYERNGPIGHFFDEPSHIRRNLPSSFGRDGPTYYGRDGPIYYESRRSSSHGRDSEGSDNINRNFGGNFFSGHDSTLDRGIRRDRDRSFGDFSRPSTSHSRFSGSSSRGRSTPSRSFFGDVPRSSGRNLYDLSYNK